MNVIARSFAALIIVFLIVGSVAVFSSMGMFTITNIQISGVDNEQVTIIHDSVLQSISGKYVGLFSKANSFLYSKSNIKNIVKSLYFEIDTIDISRADRHTMVVTIHEKIPSGLVCATLPDFNGNELSLDDPGSCYFVDSSGIIFKKAPSFSGTVYNRYYIPDLLGGDEASSSDALIGIYATSTKEFRIIQQLYDSVKQNNIITDAMLMKGDGEYELYIRNPDMGSSTAVVYFNTISSTTEQLSNFISFWNHALITARANKEHIKFDYIDVRYSPNVYHRFAQ